MFDKRYCRISAIMQLFSEKFAYVCESADLLMSWHAPSLSKWGIENTLFFYHTPSPLNVKTVQAPFYHHCCHPLLGCVPPSPLKNQIFQWTPILKLKVTKFLVKLSQLKFLVKQIKIFLFIKFFGLQIFQILVDFVCKDWSPSRKRGWRGGGALELPAR